MSQRTKPVWYVLLLASCLMLVSCGTTHRLSESSDIVAAVSDNGKRQARFTGSFVRHGIGFPTGVRAGSVVYLEKTQPPTVRKGDSFDYQFEVINLTGYPLADVKVFDHLPQGRW